MHVMSTPTLPSIVQYMMTDENMRQADNCIVRRKKKDLSSSSSKLATHHRRRSSADYKPRLHYFHVVQHVVQQRLYDKSTTSRNVNTLMCCTTLHVFAGWSEPINLLSLEYDLTTNSQQI